MQTEHFDLISIPEDNPFLISPSVTVPSTFSSVLTTTAIKTPVLENRSITIRIGSSSLKQKSVGEKSESLKASTTS